jgi:hypothetical protein
MITSLDTISTGFSLPGIVDVMHLVLALVKVPQNTTLRPYSWLINKAVPHLPLSLANLLP